MFRCYILLRTIILKLFWLHAKKRTFFNKIITLLNDHFFSAEKFMFIILIKYWQRCIYNFPHTQNGIKNGIFLCFLININDYAYYICWIIPFKNKTKSIFCVFHNNNHKTQIKCYSSR